MDENLEKPPQIPPEPGPALRFDVLPYRPDGGFQWSGMSLVIGVLGSAGLALGFVAHLIGQWFWMILVFPIFLGIALGAIGTLALKWGKVRSPWIGGIAGFLGGCGAMLAMHYCDYRDFRAEQEKLPEGVRQFFKFMKEMRAENPKFPMPQLLAPRNNAKDQPDLEEMFKDMSVEDFPGFMHRMAEHGVRIKGSHDFGNNDRGMNLGYYGSFIYWGIEVLIVAGIAFAVMRKGAAAPYCRMCDQWKVNRPLGSLHQPAEAAVEALRDGDIGRFVQSQPQVGGGDVLVIAAVCPNCGQSGTIDLQMQLVTVDSKGQKSLNTIAHSTYPGEALPVLETLFHPPEPPPSPPTTAPSAPPVEEKKELP
jgi:hypothetical protein